MPQDIHTSATFADLVLRLAERAGVADQMGSIAAAPTNAWALDKMKRCVNEGYDRFLRANKYWSFLNQDYTLTLDPDGTGPLNIEGDAARYRAPNYLAGPPKTPWRYLDDRTRRSTIQNVAVSIIDNARQIRPIAVLPPTMAAARATENPDGVGGTGGWEWIFWATPDADYAINATFRVRQHKMLEDAERPICGAEHDSALIDFGHLVWQEDDAEDPSMLARVRETVYGIPGTAQRGSLAESIDLDNQNHPDSVGQVYDPSILRNRHSRPDGGPWLPRVESHNGVPIGYEGA